MLWPQCWEYQSVLIQSLLEWMMMTMMMHRPAWQRRSGRQRLVRSQPAKQQFLWRKPIMRQSSSKLFTEQMHIPAKKKKNSNHSRNFDFPLRQLNTLTLLICGQLHGGVDVGGHLAGAEAAVLLAAVVGVVALWLQSTWANTGSVNKGGWNLSAGSVLQRCADASAGLMTGLFFVLFFIIWTSLLTELLYGFISIWRQPSFARLIESVAVDELWRNKSIESNHTFVSICSCEQRWVCRGEQLPRCFITLFRQGQQRSIFQKPLSLDVACHREGPARPTHALQDTNTQ